MCVCVCVFIYVACDAVLSRSSEPPLSVLATEAMSVSFMVTESCCSQPSTCSVTATGWIIGTTSWSIEHIATISSLPLVKCTLVEG